MADFDRSGLAQPDLTQPATQAANPPATRKKFDVIGYGINSFDENLCLKPPGLLIASAVFLTRDYLLPLVVGITMMTGSSMALPWERPEFWYLYGVPSLLVLYGWIRRVPSGDVLARWAWMNGRWLLTTGAILQMFSIVQLHGMAVRPGSDDLWLKSSLLLTLVSIAIYLLFDRRVRDAVSDFPDALARNK